MSVVVVSVRDNGGDDALSLPWFMAAPASTVDSSAGDVAAATMVLNKLRFSGCG